MNRKAVTLAALLLGFGCSHATPKPDSPTVAAAPRPAPTRVVPDHSNDNVAAHAPGKRIKVVSYGSERPKYQGHDETAYAKNRRDDLVVR